MRLTGRTVQLALGIIWIGDGLLQLQPTLFTTAFADRVLAPAASGQPAVIAWPIHELAHLVEPNHSSRFRGLTDRFAPSKEADVFLDGFSLGREYAR